MWDNCCYKISSKHWKIVFLYFFFLTCHISSSECCPIGSMLLRTVPSKRTGSWGIIPKRDLRSWRPNLQMSTPSMIIFPPEGSTTLKKAWINVDLPLPVRPTTPIFSPPLMLSVMPFRTKGVFGRYLTCKTNFLSDYLTLWNLKSTK